MSVSIYKNIIKKEWQNRHFGIEYLGIALFIAGNTYWMMLDISVWIKLFLMIVTSAVVVAVAKYASTKIPGQLTKVFFVEHEKSTRIVLTTLQSKRIMFQKQFDKDKTAFKIHSKKIIVTLESFPLNFPFGEKGQPEEATKISITGMLKGEPVFGYDLCTLIDEALAPVQKLEREEA